MKHILFYGNCQADALNSKLKLHDYVNHYIQCWSTDITKNDFTDLVNSCDIIITQPINDNYRNKDYLSTEYVINNAKKECIIIIFDSCYFNFYYVDLAYIKFNGDTLHKPVDYHFNYMVECYKNGVSVDEYINDYANNINLKSEDELNLMANTSLKELYDRYVNIVNKYKMFDNVIVISCYDFIKHNYKDHLLFYSMNHPTKLLFNYICEQVEQLIAENIMIDYDFDPLVKGSKCIIYKCVQKVVNFDIKLCEPKICGESDLKKIVEMYYKTYDEIGYKLII